MPSARRFQILTLEAKGFFIDRCLRHAWGLALTRRLRYGCRRSVAQLVLAGFCFVCDLWSRFVSLHPSRWSPAKPGKADTPGVTGMNPPHASIPESRVEPLFTPVEEASSTGVSVRQAGGRATIPMWKRTRGRAASDLPAGYRWEADDHAEELFPGGSLVPAPARRFGITDAQQWIDLCG